MSIDRTSRNATGRLLYSVGLGRYRNDEFVMAPGSVRVVRRLESKPKEIANAWNKAKMYQAKWELLIFDALAARQPQIL